MDRSGDAEEPSVWSAVVGGERRRSHPRCRCWLSRRMRSLILLVLTSLHGHAAGLLANGAPLHRHHRTFNSVTRREAFSAAATTAAAVCLPAAAATVRNTAKQEHVLAIHAERFASRRSHPSAIATMLYKNQPMRQLVATADLPANSRVAAYPVEVVSDDDELDDHDDTYAVAIYRNQQLSNGQTYRREYEGISGVPTARSLRDTFINGLPTIAMFANEPDKGGAPNCRLVFPVTNEARTGDVVLGHLETTAPVRRGEPLTWCYGGDYVDRGYQTACSELEDV